MHLSSTNFFTILRVFFAFSLTLLAAFGIVSWETLGFFMDMTYNDWYLCGHFGVLMKDDLFECIEIV
jgi:hypothetical protein